MDFSKLAKANQIFKIRVGSHLFGTDTLESDLDLYGIFMPFDEIVFGFHRCEECKLDQVDKDPSGRNTKDAVDYTLTEYRKFIRLALQNNPNILHTLFVDEKNILEINEFGRSLLSIAEKFPHKGAHHRFVKYADSQLHKMRIKPENYKNLKGALRVLESFDDKKVMADVVHSAPNLVNFSVFKEISESKLVSCGDQKYERGVYVGKVRRRIQDRLDKFTHRSSMYDEYGYDLKYASNLIHLLMESIELMNTGRVKFPLAYASAILDVKRGKFTLDEIGKWAEDLKDQSRMAYETSYLPSHAPAKEIEQFAAQQVKEWILR